MGPVSLLGERDASHCKTYAETFYMKSKSLFKKKFFLLSKTGTDIDRAALTFQQRGGAVKALRPKARPFCDRQVVPTEGGLRGSLLHAVPVP